MKVNHFLVDRIQQELYNKHIPYEKKTMFGKLVFHVNGKFCLGVCGDYLEARVDPKILTTTLKNKQYTNLDPKGKRMKGFIIIDPSEIDLDDDLERWIQLALDYNITMDKKTNGYTL